MSGKVQKKEQVTVERATYTLREVAALLGLGETSAYEKARSGKLPIRPFRVGSQYFFAKRAVNQLLGVEDNAVDEPKG